MKMIGVEQEYDSANTSIPVVNVAYTKYLSKVAKKGDRILDYGGGKYDLNIEYMKQYGAKVSVFDPMQENRKPYNAKVWSDFKKKKPDYVVCSNVLNVIKEDAILYEIIDRIHSICGKDTIVVVGIYVGNRSGIGKMTMSRKNGRSWQRNQKTDEYIPIVESRFNIIKKSGNLIIAKK